MELNHRYIAELVRRTKDGDGDSFAELYSMSFNKIYNYARHYLRDEYLAQDAVQEVFINALKNINKLKDPTLFVAWLNQIAFRVCFDFARTHKNDYKEADSELLEEVSDSKSEANPEESSMEKDEKSRLMAAIDRLKPTEREIIILRYFQALKIDDIVDATGISKSTVKRQLSSAVEKLKEIMKE